MVLVFLYPTIFWPDLQFRQADGDQKSATSQGSVPASTSSSVSNWLETHPSEITEYSRIPSPSSLLADSEAYQRGAKRTRSSSLSSPGSHQRQKLQGFRHKMASSPNTVHSGQGGGSHNVPHLEKDERSGSSSIKTLVDLDATPRAPRGDRIPLEDSLSLQFRYNFPSNPSLPLPILSPTPQRPTSHSSPSPSTSPLSEFRKRKADSADTSSTTSSTKRSRGGSPIKLANTFDFKLSDTDIEYQHFDTAGFPTPPDMEDLTADIEHIGRGVRVIPKAFRGCSVKGIHRTQPFDFSEEELAPNPEALDAFHLQILEVVSRAQDCFLQKFAEPS